MNSMQAEMHWLIGRNVTRALQKFCPVFSQEQHFCIHKPSVCSEFIDMTLYTKESTSRVRARINTFYKTHMSDKKPRWWPR